jgi:hypothetical protein
MCVHALGFLFIACLWNWSSLRGGEPSRFTRFLEDTNMNGRVDFVSGMGGGSSESKHALAAGHEHHAVGNHGRHVHIVLGALL